MISVFKVFKRLVDPREGLEHLLRGMGLGSDIWGWDLRYGVEIRDRGLGEGV